MECIEILDSNVNNPTKKFIFEDGKRTVESTYIDRPKKHILCLSSMFGCPVGCEFCASGDSYFGNLDSEQITVMANFISDTENLGNSTKRILFSFMGSGEPLLNILNVTQAIKRLHYGFQNSSFALSISGVAIDKLDVFKNYEDIRQIRPKLQFSLHSPYDEERRELVPGTAGLDEIFEKIMSYYEEINKNIDLNYAVMEGINDSRNHARDLAKIVRQFPFKLKINKYHQVRESISESSSKDKFIDYLIENGISPELFCTDGYDILAGCGQLVSRKPQNL